MKDADRVIERVARALRAKGRFVAEMGGHNCVTTLQSALIEELDRRGYDGQAANPWYFRPWMITARALPPPDSTCATSL